MSVRGFVPTLLIAVSAVFFFGLGSFLTARQSAESESEQIAASSDVLLVIDAPADDSLFLPSKLIDYLPMGKPILGLTPRAGATADLLRLLDQPLAPPDNEAEIASAIEMLIAKKRGGELAVPPSFDAVAARYDIRTTTRAFANILERCA